MAEENDSEKLGMVVFGVGIAGRVRIRDLKDPEYQDGGWKLVGFLSRYSNPFPDCCECPLMVVVLSQ